MAAVAPATMTSEATSRDGSTRSSLSGVPPRAAIVALVMSAATVLSATTPMSISSGTAPSWVTTLARCSTSPALVSSVARMAMVVMTVPCS